MEPVYDNGAMHLVSASVLTPITKRKYPYCGRVVHYQFSAWGVINVNFHYALKASSTSG